jgi:hypothetical protein
MPSSSRKIASSRANGAKSRGPATTPGKQASALNSVTHGLVARTIVLFNESADEYRAQLSEYLDHFRPQTKPEADLVHQLAATHWRIARYAGIESGLLEQRMQDQAERFEDLADLPENHRLAMAFSALSVANSSLALLNRYQARLHHEYHRILKTLLQLQSARAKQANAAELPNEPNPVSEHSTTSDAPSESGNAQLLPFPPSTPATNSAISSPTTPPLWPPQSDLASYLGPAFDVARPPPTRVAETALLKETLQCR